MIAARTDGRRVICVCAGCIQSVGMYIATEYGGETESETFSLSHFRRHESYWEL